ncbi:Apn1 protein [Lipomyces arxii]|uniref:Apn1 protein n=1 Tax=Lipomyces arxii TaxID=56418 RepID=UPI0034CDAB36
MPPKAGRKRSKQKDDTPVEESEMFSRTSGLKMLVGAHVSSAKGVFNAVTNIHNIGGNALALFVKQPQRWTAAPMKDEEITEWKEKCNKMGYDTRKHILPHGSYLVNLANLDEEKNAQAYSGFVEELKRCELLDIGLFNFHPGSALNYDKADAIKKLAFNINRAIEETKFVKIVIENMAGHGNLIGSCWKDIAEVIELVHDKSRVGVCVDTCHTFAAGYDIRTKEKFDAVWKEFDEVIGLKYLASMHINDSKAPMGSNRDLHQNIGLGFLGLETFRVLMNTEHLKGLPLILETPTKDDPSVWGQEIKLLEWLIGRDEDDDEFIARKEELSALGATERADMQAKEDKKRGASEKKKQTTLSFGNKKRKTEFDDEL